MNAGNWLTLISIAAALAIAYMHRKQMRQIELRRVDPTLPVHPPPHPVTRFIKSYGIYVWCLGWAGYDVVLLIRDLRKTTPVTREVVAFIVEDTIAIVLMIVLAMSIWFGDRVLFRLLKDSAKIAIEMADILKDLTQRMLSLDARITKLEEAGKIRPVPTKK
jgi:hypothetical protein